MLDFTEYYHNWKNTSNF